MGIRYHNKPLTPILKPPCLSNVQNTSWIRLGWSEISRDYWCECLAREELLEEVHYWTAGEIVNSNQRLLLLKLG